MAQAEGITTAIRELMSRGRLAKSTNPVRLAHIEFVAARWECSASDLCRRRFGGSRWPRQPSGKAVRGAARLSDRGHRRHGTEHTR